MANEDDFTFCRVEPPEAQKIADDIGGIHIVDGNESVLDRNSNSENGVIWRGSSVVPKEEKVGSLSFSVTEASSSRKEPTQRAKFAVQEGSGSSTLELKAPPVKKSVTRAKVPFEKGYSQMDWLKLTRTHPDLADLKGQSNKRLISLNEVKQHKSEGSMWTVLKGRVYNLTPYMKFHPGGDEILMKAVGKDCTSLFNKYHAWVNAEFLLEKCLVGMLDQSQ